MKLFQAEFTKSEIDKIAVLFASGEIGFGSNVLLFESKFAEFSQGAFNIAVNSASAAAFLIFDYLKESFGTCDVYTPSLGFTSPSWAARHFEHRLIFVDVENDLLFSSESYRQRRKNLNSSNQPVLMPLLYGGVSGISHWNPLGDEIIVIDAAHCPTPTIKYNFAFFSFHPLKPIAMSDGGLIACDSEHAANYFTSYRNFGRKQSDLTYDITQSGFKFYMNNLNATIGLGQLDSYGQRLEKRKMNHEIIHKLVGSALIKQNEQSSYYFATFLTEEAPNIRKALGLTLHYPPLHATSYYKDGSDLPNTQSLVNRIVNFPIYNSEAVNRAITAYQGLGW